MQTYSSPFAYFLQLNATLISNSTNTNGTFVADPVMSLANTIITFTLLIGLILVSILCIILSCVFCRKQPLKSRGCTYAALLICVFLLFLVFVIRELFGSFFLAAKPSILCYSDMLGIMPLIIAYCSLLIARNIRFVFILSVNKFKNIIFGNTKVSELLKEQEAKRKKKKEAVKEIRKSIFKRKSSVSRIDNLNLGEAIEQPQSLQEEAPVSQPDSQAVSEIVDDKNDEKSQVTEINTAVDLQSQNPVKDMDATELTADTDDMMSNADDVASYFENGFKVENKAQRKLQCLQCMTSYWLSFAICFTSVFLWFVFAALYMGISVGSDPNCNIVAPSTAYVVIAVLYVTSVLVLLFDLLVNIKDVVKCRIRHLFCVDDKFLFRIEFIMIVIANTLVVLFNILGGWVQEIYFVIYQLVPLIGTFGIFFFGFLHIFVLSGFILLVTIIWECKEQARKKKSKRDNALSGTDQVLNTVMKDVKLQTMFREFCVQEWSLENFLCYQDVLLWSKRVKSSYSKLKTAIQLYNKFIKVGCSLEINISNHSRDKAKVLVQTITTLLEKQQHQQQQQQDIVATTAAQPTPTAQSTPTSPQDSTIGLAAAEVTNQTSAVGVVSKEEYKRLAVEVNEVFDIIFKEVKMNLHDTLFRFLLTNKFKQHTEEVELKENILDNV